MKERIAQKKGLNFDGERLRTFPKTAGIENESAGTVSVARIAKTKGG